MSTSSKLLAVWDDPRVIISRFCEFSVISSVVILSPSSPLTLIRPAVWSKNNDLAEFDGSSGIATLAPSFKYLISVIFD